MRQIQIERAVLIGDNHTEAGERFAIGVDIEAELAAYLVRNGVASDPDASDSGPTADEMTVEPEPEPVVEPVIEPVAAEKPAK